MAQMAFEICGCKCMSMLKCETSEKLFLLIHPMMMIASILILHGMLVWLCVSTGMLRGQGYGFSSGAIQQGKRSVELREIVALIVIERKNSFIQRVMLTSVYVYFYRFFLTINRER
jgi:hypothetical protein